MCWNEEKDGFGPLRQFTGMRVINPPSGIWNATEHRRWNWKKERKKSCTGRNKCWIIYTNQNIHSNLVSLALNQLKEASWKTQPTPITEVTLSLSRPHGSKAVNGDMWTKVHTCMHVFSEALWPWCVSGQMCWQDLCSWPKQQHREPVRITAQAVALKM